MRLKHNTHLDRRISIMLTASSNPTVTATHTTIIGTVTNKMRSIHTLIILIHVGTILCRGIVSVLRAEIQQYALLNLSK